jgi:hypothetical protein
MKSMAKNLNSKLGVFGRDKILREDKKSYAEDYYCVTCYKKGEEIQAEKFWPVFDIDQETIPKPYCQSCLDENRLNALIEISE